MTDAKECINASELEWEQTTHGERFESRRKRLSLATGGQLLGCSLFRVASGKTAFPAHLHHANEEALYILAGTGTLRLGDRELPLQPGDYVTLPAGGPAHQLINSSKGDLEYLCLSTMISPEVVEYPDSEKVGVIVSGEGSVDPKERKLFKFYPQAKDVNIYEGE